jgi:Sulfotransferase family
MKQDKAVTAGLPKQKLRAETRIVARLLTFTTLSAAATSILWTLYASPRIFIDDYYYRNHAVEDAFNGPRRPLVWDAAGHEVVTPITRRVASTRGAEDASISLQQSQSFHQQQHHKQIQETLETSTISKQQQQQQQSIRLPPTCQVQNVEGRRFDRIHFLHMRKAGGTALRMYFKRLEKENKIPVHVDEGPEFPEQPGDYNNTFYVTVIREPMARSISQYKFDQRWDCPTQLKRKHFVPTNDNVFNTFEDFVHNPSRFHPDIRGPLWICSSNCYARWATGILYPDEQNVSDAAMLAQASSVLNRYHLVLVQEWIQKDAAYRAAISRLFHTTLGTREYFAECARQSRRANEQVPLVIHNATLQQLQQNNQVDSELFTNLTACQYDPSSFQPLQYNVRRAVPQKTG